MFTREEILPIFAANLKHYRNLAQLSQAALAGKVDIDERQIRRFEAAEQAPTIVHAYRMAQVLNIKVDDFFTKR
ncbi:MAG: helix-turn-helix transcriptional regulator [Bacteroidota bacterium]